MQISNTQNAFNPVTLTVTHVREAVALVSGLKDAGLSALAKELAKVSGLVYDETVTSQAPTPVATPAPTPVAAQAAAPTQAPAPTFNVGDLVRVIRGDGNKLPVGNVYTVSEVLRAGATVRRRSGYHTLTKPAVRLERSQVNYRDAIAWDTDRFVLDTDESDDNL